MLSQTNFTALEPLQELQASGAPEAHSLWFQLGDLDGDGLTDLAMIEDENTEPGDRVWVAYQRNGLLQAPEVIDTLENKPANVGGGNIAIADLNLDGRSDILIASLTHEMVAELRQKDGSYRRVAKRYPTQASIIESAVAIGDLNCDGCPDAVGSQVGQICVFPGIGCAP